MQDISGAELPVTVMNVMNCPNEILVDMDRTRRAHYFV
jgi:hypothetical protein